MTDIKQTVESNFSLPYTPYDWQYATALKCYEKGLCVNEDGVGYGKTIMSIVSALYAAVVDDVSQILVLMPPALMVQYEEFVTQIGGIDKVVIYEGTPAERKKLVLENAAVIIMSYNIFRIDYERIYKLSLKSKFYILGDELSLKSLGKTHKKLKKLIYRRQRLRPTDKPFHLLQGMNATPYSDQLHVYNWLAILDPTIYKSLKVFKDMHVEHEDPFGRPTSWKEPELIAENFERVSVSSPKGMIKLPECVPTTVLYDLSPKHMALYKKVVAGEFENLPPDKVEMAVKALFFALQKLIFVPQEWGLDERPAVMDIVDSYIDQIGKDQVVIFTRHVMVTQLLHQHLPDSTAYYGKITKEQKKENYASFQHGYKAQLVANMDSLAKGANMQFCRRELVAELPFRPDVWEQMIGRVHRQGQTETTFIHIPIAKGTIQQKIYKGLIDKDFDLRYLAKDKRRLKEFLEIV